MDPSFQGVNRLFVLSFEDNAHQTRNRIFSSKIRNKRLYNVIIDEQNLFDQPLKNDFRSYDNIQKIATIPRDDYTTGCLRSYSYFKKHYKLTAIDLNKQQARDADSKNIQQQWCNHY